jgi:hypothetical protein
MAEPSPFKVLESTLRVIATGPGALCVDGAAVGHGLPPRSIPLGELKGLLLHPSTTFAARDAALQALLAQARAGRAGAVVALAGMVLPGLRRAAAPLATAWPGRAADLEGAMLVGLVEAWPRIGPGAERVAAKLIWPAVKAAHRTLVAELSWQDRHCRQAESARPPSPFGHPELVLGRAVAEAVVHPDDAELVAESRLGETSLQELAVRWGVSYPSLRKRRARAERALVAWLSTDPGAEPFVPKPARDGGSAGAGRPRARTRPATTGCAQPARPRR